MGAPGYPPVTMFKIVLLQQWHTLSDPGAEEAGRQAEMTPANVHDSRLGEALIQGDEQGFFADRAYDSQALRARRSKRAGWSTGSPGRSNIPAIRWSPGKRSEDNV